MTVAFKISLGLKFQLEFYWKLNFSWNLVEIKIPIGLLENQF